nr:uncharacterized protein LOC124818159 [Hydra vulgaris]
MEKALQNNLNLENFDTLDEDLLDEIFAEYINKAFEKVVSLDEYSCITCGKICKSKGGLKRNANSAPALISNVSKLDCFTVNIFSNIVKGVQNVLFCDNCYPEETRQTIKEFEYNDILYNEVSKLLTEFISSRNADIFLSKFYSSIVLYAYYYIFNLDKRLCALLALHIGNHILGFYKKQLNSPYEESKQKPISAQKIDGLQYLAGYVIHKFIKKTRNNKNFNSKIN